MLGKGKRSPSSSPSPTLPSTHPARRRSPSGMVRALDRGDRQLTTTASRGSESPPRGARETAFIVHRTTNEPVRELDRAHVWFFDLDAPRHPDNPSRVLLSAE